MQSEDAKRLMRQLYKEVSGYEIPKDEQKEIKLAKGNPLYGEIRFAALEKLFHELKLSKDDSFYDLGSGVGKVVIQAALTTKAKKCVGFELSKARHDDAKKVLSDIKKLGLITDKEVGFEQDNFLEADLSDATVIYTCSTAFSESFMKLLVKKLATLSDGLIVATLRDFPEQKSFSLINVLHLDMTWIRKTAVYIYEKKPQ